MTAQLWVILATVAAEYVLYLILRFRQEREKLKYMPPRDWPLPFDYSRLPPPKKMQRPPRFIWPSEGAK